MSLELTAAILSGRIPDHVVVRQVGHGAMGVVFEAQQESLGRRVAIKILPPNLALRERTMRRFLREAESMGSLDHPNIVDVYLVGRVLNLPFFSMKFVEGPPLDKVLRAGPLAIADVVQIGIDVAAALAHAHAKGVLHRDVKPANLLRDGPRVVLTDFGLARPLDSADAGSMTESGDLVGTPLYMSPEQISGEGERVDGRADVWGLGVTLYELLTQRTPFSGTNAQGILHAILHKDPPLLRKQRDDVPAELEAIVLKCLEKDPARRYSGAAALVDDLRAASEGRSVSAAPPRFFDPGVRWVWRHPREAAIVLACVVLALGAWGSKRASEKLVDSTREKLNSAMVRDVETRAEKDAAVRDKIAAAARYELSEARLLWAAGNEAGNDRECYEAEGRVLDLLDSLSLDQHSDIIAEGMAVIAGWMHKQPGGDARVQSFLDQRASREAPSNALLLRAAALTGLEQLSAALDVHRQRAAQDPSAPGPVLDAARLVRRLALDARSAQDDAGVRLRMGQALVLLHRAIELAILARDSPILTTLLVERARILLDLGLEEDALLEIERALLEDPERLEAQSLRRAAERRRAERRGEVLAYSEPESESPPAGLSLPQLLGTREIETPALDSAGRGLTSIYRGLHNLLRSAAQPEGAAAVETPTPVVPGGG